MVLNFFLLHLNMFSPVAQNLWLVQVGISTLQPVAYTNSCGGVRSEVRTCMLVCMCVCIVDV